MKIIPFKYQLLGFFIIGFYIYYCIGYIPLYLSMSCSLWIIINMYRYINYIKLVEYPNYYRMKFSDGVFDELYWRLRICPIDHTLISIYRGYLQDESSKEFLHLFLDSNITLYTYQSSDNSFNAQKNNDICFELSNEYYIDELFVKVADLQEVMKLHYGRYAPVGGLKYIGVK